jgi:hypothetical protein
MARIVEGGCMNTGGPAFPICIDLGQGVEYHKGMYLRDYFAAKAMLGLITRESTGAFNFETHPDDPWRVAIWAYDVADQMLKVREMQGLAGEIEDEARAARRCYEMADAILSQREKS